MSRRRKKKSEEVEMNVASMLDMAFQLLTFFILTFKPAPVEGDIVLHMPPPIPTTVIKGAEAAGSNEQNKSPVQGLNSLIITVVGSPTGTISFMAVGDTPVVGLGNLEKRLKEVFGDQASPFDQILVQVGSTLHYDELMQVIDICTKQKLPNGERLTKMSLVELPSSG